MRNLRGALVGAMLLGLLVAMPQATAIADAPSAPYTALFFDNGQGSWFGGKGSRTLDESNSTPTLNAATGAGGDTLNFGFPPVPEEPGSWTLHLESPNFALFAPGLIRSPSRAAAPLVLRRSNCLSAVKAAARRPGR